MKKITCVLLSLAMLCSFMVVNVSAANVYEGEGFTIDTDYTCVENSSSTSEWDYGTIWYYFFCFEGIGAELEIEVESLDYLMSEESYNVDSVAELYEAFSEEMKYEDEFEMDQIMIDGVPAFIASYEGDDATLFVSVFSDNYIYDMQIETDNKDSASEMLDLIVADFCFTDSTSWVDSIKTDIADKDDAENKDDTDKDGKTEKDEEKSSDNNTIIIIVAIVTTGVVVLGIVAIVVLGKKKKS